MRSSHVSPNYNNIGNPWTTARTAGTLDENGLSASRRWCFHSHYSPATRTAKPSESAMSPPADGFAPLLSELGLAIMKAIDSGTGLPQTRAGIHLLS